jgi:hypothetical protein
MRSRSCSPKHSNRQPAAGVTGTPILSRTRLGLALAIGLLLWGVERTALPQGMASIHRKAQPRKPLPPGRKAPAVNYVDLSAQAGLRGVNISGDLDKQAYIVETTGTGVAIIDYDNDDLPDIFLVNADRLDSGLPRPTHHLYKNLGGLRFVDVTEKAGVTHTGWGQGVCAEDIDNDGNIDLLVTQWGQNALFHNRGDGTFREESKERGLTSRSPRWSTGCAFLDYDRDGDLDLFVAHYVDFDPKTTPRPGQNAPCLWKEFRVVCGPRGLPAETMSLFENDGHGNFIDVSERSGVSGPKAYYGFTALTGDFDNDGWPDVYVACDSTASLLYHNRRDKTFEEIGVSSGVAYNEDGQDQAGMGATAGDFNGDGFLDIFKTNFSDDAPTLYRNNRDGTFTDVTLPAGLAVHTEYLGWGTAFLDFDQDGWKDIFVANGHVYPEVDTLPVNETFKQPRLLYWNRGDGQFFDLSSQAGPGILEKRSSRGVAIGDLDNDGELEIVVVNMHETPSLLKNTRKTGGSVLIRALTSSGRDAIGARITLTAHGRKQVDEVRSGGYHISQGDLRVHFGLGGEPKANLEIRWPDGTTEVVRDLAANQSLVIQQGTGIIRTRKYERQ